MADQGAEMKDVMSSRRKVRAGEGVIHELTFAMRKVSVNESCKLMTFGESYVKLCVYGQISPNALLGDSCWEHLIEALLYWPYFIL